MTNNGTGVYFVLTGDERYVKIGYSGCVLSRLGQLQTIGPGTRDLRMLGYIPGTRATEKALHRRFAAYRDVGEWFFYSGDVRVFAEQLLQMEVLTQPEARKVTVGLQLSDDLIREIEEFRYRQQIPTKVGAFEFLLRFGLEADPPNPNEVPEESK